VLDRGRQAVRPDVLAVGARVGHPRLAAGSEREALAAAPQHAEVIVVGVVLHHQHDDVLDLRQQIFAGGLGRHRARPGPRAAHQALPALQLTAFEPLPHDRAVHRPRHRGIVSRPTAARRGLPKIGDYSCMALGFG
jgi:hypothetical protein